MTPRFASDWERGDDEPARLCRDSIRPGAQRPGSSKGGRGTGHSPAQGGRCGAAAATEEPRPVDLPTGYATAVSPAQPIRSNQRAIAGRRAIGGAGAEGNRPTGGRGGPLARILPQPPTRRGDCWLAQAGVCGEACRADGRGQASAQPQRAKRSEDAAVKGRVSATPTSTAEIVTGYRRNEDSLAASCAAGGLGAMNRESVAFIALHARARTLLCPSNFLRYFSNDNRLLSKDPWYHEPGNRTLIKYDKEPFYV
jgi:hypothetical protein